MMTALRNRSPAGKHEAEMKLLLFYCVRLVLLLFAVTYFLSF